MTSGERKLLLIFGIGCLMIIGIILISLWHYKELIGFLLIGLTIFSVLVLLLLLLIKTLTDSIVRIHEQKLRQERLRPNNRGYYEIPLDDAKLPMFPPSNTPQQEEQETYQQEFVPTQFNRRRRD